MPRRPRIDIVGTYHLVNRGVDRRVTFKDHDDFTYFLNLLCAASKIYGIRVHSYVLMSNHYHLLVETTQENLSKYMKHINASYSIYFNKRHKRTGHLWQGRFKSWFVTNEAYLYALIAYIEYNPIKAHMTQTIGEYKYSSSFAFSGKEEAITCLKESIVFEMYNDIKERLEFIAFAHDERVLDEIKKASNLVVTSIKEKKIDAAKIKSEFHKAKTIQERNHIIVEANRNGVSQHKLATIVGLSQSQINRIVQKNRG